MIYSSDTGFHKNKNLKMALIQPLKHFMKRDKLNINYYINLKHKYYGLNYLDF